MRKAEVLGEVLIWTAGVMGAIVGLRSVESIEDTDTTATAIKKASFGAMNITVYALAMNHSLRK